MQPSGISRRKFTQVTLLGTAGMTLLPAREAAAFPFAGFLAGLGRFAAGVASSVLVNQITKYLDSLQNPSFKRSIEQTNETLATAGFTDMTHSEVWHNRERPDEDAHQIFYPLLYRECDCLHFAAPFFKVDCGCEHITHIEGGHMAGLALSAELIAKQSSRAAARSLLFPKRGGRLAVGDRRSGYRQPLVYHSDEATVAVDYRPKDDQSGHIIVEATSDTNGRTLLGKDFQVRFA